MLKEQERDEGRDDGICVPALMTEPVTLSRHDVAANVRMRAGFSGSRSDCAPTA